MFKSQQRILRRYNSQREMEFIPGYALLWLSRDLTPFYERRKPVSRLSLTSLWPLHSSSVSGILSSISSNLEAKRRHVRATASIEWLCSKMQLTKSLSDIWLSTLEKWLLNNRKRSMYSTAKCIVSYDCFKQSPTSQTSSSIVSRIFEIKLKRVNFMKLESHA